VGPTEYLIIGFEGNQFNGEIMAEIRRLSDEKTIRILDLLVVTREESGELISMEMSDLPELREHADKLDHDMGQWFSQDDVEQIGELIPASSTVAMVLVEFLWAKPLGDAIARANGRLLAETNVPRELMDEVESLIGAGTRSDINRIIPDNATPYRRAA